MTQSDNFLNILNSNEFTCDYDIVKALIKEGLKEEDFVEICQRLNRAPNRTELGMFGVMWSEHCCYRNSRPLLQNFPTKAPHVLVGPGENAGVIDIGNGDRLVFKIESHNHPSAIEPFQGAATGVGGILRDIFTMGARPIAILNALRFGPLNKEKNISLIQGVVSGIAHYGNCVGVPTVGGEVVFDESYSGNPLVNAMAIGLMETQDIVCSGAKGIGYSVVYVGNTTGRDGMGGASFASAELTDSSYDDRPAVQVGDPFFEKGLIEACLEAFKAGDVIAAQDMGAAGLTCSSSEMAAKGDVGIELDLDSVPAREKGMTAYEFLLSESQERMLFVVKPGLESKLMNRFTKWGLYASIVGKVIPEKRVRVIHNKQIVADVPTTALADDTPVEKHSVLKEPPKFIQNHWKWTESLLDKETLKGIYKKDKLISWNQILLNLLDSPSIASKSWIYNQYDYQVQSNTVLGPGLADAAIIRIRSQDDSNSTKNSNKGIAAVVDCPNRWVYLDPARGSMAAVAEAARNISCVGALPLAVTDNLNFSSPQNEIGFWQLASSCEGLSIACRKMETPVIGGNVSLYNETKEIDNTVKPIQPTPIIGMVGLLDDLNNICTPSWKNDQDIIYLLGLPFDNKIDSRVTLSGSAYLEFIHELITGRPPEIDLDLEKQVQAFLREAISKRYIESAHDVSDGGIAIAISECSISSKYGAKINLPSLNSRIDRLLFAEGGARIIISVSPSNQKNISSLVNEFNNSRSKDINLTKLGVVQKVNHLFITQNNCSLVDIPISKLRFAFENSLSSRINNKF
ncbi:phosphoribosylformylglycinamidine synthase subunit PurL [Prochlorococcus sp. MIT 1223]|uniref:phosphoribosylformylglycinamidine synthase subunit PurL n=1 Tax=Prochlorococcus sp. MIT 1223 TaxID=3096217 RepID=UPI002A756AC7|nr:phosphoribosylformylglycinamidine synthase subunit PurL [Prochlorococcus sp. MIT 1223]